MTRTLTHSLLTALAIPALAACMAEVGDEAELNPFDELGIADADELAFADGDEEGVLAAELVSTTKRELRYFLVPHPDDEFSSWALVENQPRVYPVFIHLTLGEATNYCHDYSGYQPHLGEAPPGNRTGYRNRSCAANRIGSALAFYDAMTDLDPYIGPVPTRTRYARGNSSSCVASSRQTFRVMAGRNMAMVFFNLGDGNLTTCEVRWALREVRQLRGRLLPNIPEGDVVAAGFRNGAYGNCLHYDHPDHVAVHRAVWGTNFRVPGEQLGRTCTTDPDTDLITRVDQYSAMRVVGERRVGAFQKYYGWLQTEPWPVGHQRNTVFPQIQAFWSRF